MIRKSKLRELVGHIVKKVLSEMEGDDSIAPITTMSSSNTNNNSTTPLSPGMQQKLDRERKKAAVDTVKGDKRDIDNKEKEIKYIENEYKKKRRYDLPKAKEKLKGDKKDLVLGK